MITYNSRYIEQKLSEIKDRKSKNAFLESIMNAPDAVVLFQTDVHKTVLFSGNKGPKTNTWEQTKEIKSEYIDAGAFNDAVDYLLRNGISYGNIMLLNKYGRIRIITHKDIKSKVYIRKTKGFL